MLIKLGIHSIYAKYLMDMQGMSDYMPVMFCGYQTKYQAQQQRFLLILIYSSRYVQLQSG